MIVQFFGSLCKSHRDSLSGQDRGRSVTPPGSWPRLLTKGLKVTGQASVIPGGSR